MRAVALGVRKSEARHAEIYCRVDNETCKIEAGRSK